MYTSTVSYYLILSATMRVSKEYEGNVRINDACMSHACIYIKFITIVGYNHILYKVHVRTYCNY